MPRITLTDFVEVVSKAGITKATKIAQIKNRGDYDPVLDFYKPLREGLVSIHKGAGGRSALGGILKRVQDPKKVKNYSALITGYRTWWGRKTLVWFRPTTATYAQHGVEVSINPELGLEINGQPHLVKLYLKDEKLSKTKVDLITGLMEVGLRSQVATTTSLSLLDVRNGKLFTSSLGSPAHQPMINAELSYIASLWPHV